METARPRTARRACSASGRSTRDLRRAPLVASRTTSMRAKVTTKKSAAARRPIATPQRKPKPAVTAGMIIDDQVVGGGHPAPLVDERADQQVQPDHDDAGGEDPDRKHGNDRGADRERQGAGRRDDPARRWSRRAEPVGKDRLRHSVVAAGAAAEPPTRGWRSRRRAGRGRDRCGIRTRSRSPRRSVTVPTMRDPRLRPACSASAPRSARPSTASGCQFEQAPGADPPAEGAEEQPRLARSVDAGSRKGERDVEEPARQNEPEREDDGPAAGAGSAPAITSAVSAHGAQRIGLPGSTSRSRLPSRTRPAERHAEPPDDQQVAGGRQKAGQAPGTG